MFQDADLGGKTDKTKQNKQTKPQGGGHDKV